MAEYISKEAVIKKIAEVQDKATTGTEDVAYYRAIKIIRDEPAADVQPIKHGEWDFQGYQLFKCTNCKEIFTQNQLEAMQNHIDQEEFTFPNFCPNCGADMRGDTNG